MSINSNLRNFLSQHGIPLEKVFDATGFTRQQYSIIMKALGYEVAIGVSPCKMGHRIRSRSGHCVMCNPANLSFQNRYHSPQFIYLAQAREYIKIGSTTDIQSREESLAGYGGIEDWRVRDFNYVDTACELEKIMHSKLAPYRVSKFTLKETGKFQATYELFRCTYRRAKKVYRDVLSGEGISV